MMDVRIVKRITCMSLKKDQCIILDMSTNGDSGVTRIRGLITFVRGAKPDDRVRIKITKIGKGYARGQLIAFLN